jgi:FkbM family methyltransferase
MLKRGLHAIVRILHLEKVFVNLGQRLPFFRRLVPLHTAYPPHTLRLVKRNGSKFLLDISDYMQWYLFVRELDISWRIALDYITPGSIVLDIGANIGQFSLPLSETLCKNKIDCSVYAFEPNPEIFNSLKNNIEMNRGLSSVLTSYPYAVGDHFGEIPFIYGMRNSGAGRFIHDETKSIVKVQLTTVEEFLRQSDNNGIVSFIKIDVEGFEPEVIKGADSIIKKHKPILFFEFSPTWCKERGVDAFLTLLYLKECGYTLYYEKYKRLIRVGGDFAVLQNIYQTNILAVAEPTTSERHG